ncbi:unnamed protein product [Mucor hiemalis]
MWSHIETTERASMHQHKIKCVFVPSAKEEEEDNVITEEEKNVATAAPIPEQVNSAGIASSAVSSNPIQSNTTTTTTATRDIPPVPAHREPIVDTTPASVPVPVTPPTAAAPAPVAPSTHAPIPAESIVPETSIKSTTAPTVAAAVLPSPITTTAAPIQTPRDITTTDKELKEALEKIRQLEKQLSEIQKEEGLRVRNNNGGRKLASTVQPLDAVHQHLAALEKPRADEGYPPQVVLIVAVLVFIFTYLFF